MDFTFMRLPTDISRHSIAPPRLPVEATRKRRGRTGSEPLEGQTRGGHIRSVRFLGVFVSHRARVAERRRPPAREMHRPARLPTPSTVNVQHPAQPVGVRHAVFRMMADFVRDEFLLGG